MKPRRVRSLIRWLITACCWGLGPALAVTPPLTPEDFKTRFAAFDGTVYTRFKIDAPAEFHYFMSITAEIQPYGATFQEIGRFGAAPSPGRLTSASHADRTRHCPRNSIPNGSGFQPREIHSGM